MMTSSIEDAIKNVEKMYQALTGCEPPPSNGAYAPVPPEADLVLHVEAQLSKLAKLVENPKPIPPPTWSPPISLWEDKDELVVDVELAGVDQSGVEVGTFQQLVTIWGSRTPSSRARRLWVNERSFGPFCRTLLLPPDMDAKSMQTTSHDGVLQLRFTRRSASREPQAKKQN